MAQYKIIVDTKGSTKKEKEKKQLALATGTNSSDDKDEQVNSLVNREAVKVITTIIDTGINVANAYVSTIGIRTDNQARQNEINNIINGVGFLTNQIGGIANSISIGKTLGAPAAIAAMAAQVVNETINIVNNIKEYNREITNDALDSVHNGERIGRISTDNNR